MVLWSTLLVRGKVLAPNVFEPLSTTPKSSSFNIVRTLPGSNAKLLALPCGCIIGKSLSKSILIVFVTGAT
jgi:hypothetical protein